MNTNTTYEQIHAEIRRQSKLFTLFNDTSLFLQQHIPGYFRLSMHSGKLLCKLYEVLLRKAMDHGADVPPNVMKIFQGLQLSADAALAEWARSHDSLKAQSAYHAVYSEVGPFAPASNTEAVEQTH